MRNTNRELGVATMHVYLKIPVLFWIKLKQYEPGNIAIVMLGLWRMGH